MFSHIQNVKDFFWHPNFSWWIDTPPVTGAKEICPSSPQERGRGTLTSMESGWTQRWKGGFPWGIPKTMAFNTDMIEVWMIWCSNLNTSICWRAVYLSFYLPIYPSIYLSICLSLYSLEVPFNHLAPGLEGGAVLPPCPGCESSTKMDGLYWKRPSFEMDDDCGSPPF